MSLLGLIPDNDPNQALRVKRFLMAALVYVIAVAMMGLYVREGIMETRHWAWLSVAIGFYNLLVYTFLRSGRNESLRDPSITGWQMVGACVFMASTMYLVDAARGALLLLYLVLLQFGVLRLRVWQYVFLGLFALVAYAGAIAAVHVHRPLDVNLRIEMLQFAALAVMVPCGAFFAGYVGGLRRAVRDRQIALQRANERVHELSQLDQLTGVRNRRSIIDAVEQERERAERLGQPLSVVLLDLDDFSAINRAHGHDVGDDILARVAAGMRAPLSPIDSIGRYGGEEFLVILPDSDVDEAMRTAERLRQAVETCRPGELAPSIGRLGLSVGVAALAEDESAWHLIDRARHAADDAHERGGSRVIASSGAEGGSQRA